MSNRRYSVFVEQTECIDALVFGAKPHKCYCALIVEVPAGVKRWLIPFNPDEDAELEYRLFAYRLTESEVLKLADELNRFGLNGCEASCPCGRVLENNFKRINNGERVRYNYSFRQAGNVPENAIKPKYREQFKKNGFNK